MNQHRSTAISTLIAAIALLGGSASAAVNIVPKPSTMTLGGGNLTLAAGEAVSIYADDASDSTLPWVEKLLKNAKLPTTRAGAAAGAKIAITLKADGTLGLEGYKLNVGAAQITITAPTLTGQFYAVQTLRQMFPVAVEDSTSAAPGAVTLQQVDITDKPRFEYRGTMIDPVRHFAPLPYLYQHVDRMALYKMNRLHFLLSNDQGFRLESLVYPKLHQMGATTNCGGGHPAAGERWYYTQDEMRAFVKYAADRKIKVIPEIDMPGHCTAMNFCYPQLGTPNNAIQTSEDVGKSIMNTSGPNAAFCATFCGNLWREMTTIFTSDQYQIGGDECFNISATEFKRFTMAIQDTLLKLGKKCIAWDEVGAAGALLPSSWSQDWHPNSAVGQVMSSCTYFYMDMANKKGDPSTNNWCTTELSIQGVYGATFSSGTLKGVEATLFSERVTKYPDYWDRQLWPRGGAVAEIGWAVNNNDLNGFLSRMGPQGSRMNTMGIKFYNSPGVTWDGGTPNTKMTNLYDHFTPVITPVAIAKRDLRRSRAAAVKPRKGYDPLGRTVRLSASGYPEAIIEIKKP